jgi:autotransporter-associated beta strand protein
MQTTGIFKTTCLCAGLLALGFATVQAQTITNNDAGATLNLGTEWVGGTAPGPANVAVWNNLAQVNTTETLGANLAWAGIQIFDPATLITISAGNTLTNGASGIDLSAATNGLTLNCPVVLGANQNWNVTNGLTLTAGGVVSGSKLLTLNNGGNNNGTIVLSVANTYTGGTVINSGIIQPVNAASFGPTSNVITNNGGTLLFSTFPNGGIIANNERINGTNNVDMFNRNASIVLDGAFSGSGTVYVTNDTSSGSTLTFGGNGPSGSGNGDFNSFTGSIIVLDTNASGTASAGTLRFNNGGTSANLGNAGMTLNLGGPNSSIHFTEKNSGTTTHFGALIGGPNTQLASVETYVVGEANLNTTFAGTITGGSASLTKSGTGVLILTGNNANTGATTINGGVLQIGDGVTSNAGKLGSGAITVNANGKLLYNKPDSFSVANNISGAGTLIQTNTSVMTYTGNNSSSGTAVISQGTLALVSPGVMSCPISVASGATFDVSQTSFNLSSTLSGFGTVTGLVTSASGTINPGGTGAAGTLSFSNGVTESGSVNHLMELSSVGSTNDLINIVGDLTVSGTNNIIISHFGGGTIPSGTYTLINYSGNFNGGLNNFAVNVPGGNVGVLGNPLNQITITISAAGRGATNLTWVGDGVANNWDTTSSNWVNGATQFAFQTGDSVGFNATGATNPTVNLNLTVLPASVVVNSTSNYTLTGIGSISGTTGLVKTNSGTLNVQTTNSYTGQTIIGGGTLDISSAANGGLASGIGAASSDPSNLVFYGSTLGYTGPTAGTDRGATLNGSGGTFDVVSGTTLTLNGTITGSGALTKIDNGTLVLANPNTYASGTVISNGVLALGSNSANNNGAGGSGVGATNEPVIFYGGTLQLFGYNASSGNNYNTFYNPLVVPAGQTGTLQLFPRGPVNTGGSAGLFSSLSGSGTLNLVVNYVRDALSGDWSAFTGLINVTSRNASGDEMRINNNFGYSNAAIYLNATLTMDSTLTSGATINIGELGGVSTATIGAGNTSQPNPTWVVGWKSTTNTFAGTIANDGTTSITKVGTGTWYLAGQNTYTGSTTISNGVLALTNNATTSIDGSIGNTTNIFINAGAILDVSGLLTPTLTLGSSQNIGGAGKLNGSLDTTSGATITPGIGAAGTLTVTNAIAFGGNINIAVDHTATGATNSSLAAATITIPSGATLNVNQGTNDLVTGDTFKLFKIGDSSVSALGSLTVNLPATSPDSVYTYAWDYSQLATNGTITLTSGAPATAPAPVAGFSSSATNIFVTQAVLFTNTSTGSFTNSAWSFGDGNSTNLNGASVSNNVSDTYATTGTFPVQLIVTGAGGSSTNTPSVYVVVKPKPVLGKPVLSGGNFIFSGTNGAVGAQYRILTTTNIALSLSNWTPVLTNTVGSDGSYGYTNSSPTNKASFFLIVSP